MKIAFIGVGNMGAPMAINLAKKGYEIVAFDKDEQQLKIVTQNGVQDASSLGDAVYGCEAVITMLPNDAIVNAVYCGEDGILYNADEGALLIDCSTVSPQCSKSLGKLLNKSGFRYVEAPVSGGIKGAQNGELAFICGGSEELVKEATPIIKCMGTKILRAGDYGSGAVAKLCNNLLLAIQMNATAEVINLGCNLGLDASVLSEIMKSSSGNNWCLQGYNPCPGVMAQSPASNEFKAGFSVGLMLKDIGLIVEAAQGSNQIIPFGLLAQSRYNELGRKEANGALDFSAIWQLYQ